MAKKSVITTGTFREPTIDSFLRASLDEMETIRSGLLSQRGELLDRRAYLASAIKSIDSDLEIIDSTLLMIDASRKN
jgi:hypothetical protein